MMLHEQIHEQIDEKYVQNTWAFYQWDGGGSGGGDGVHMATADGSEDIEDAETNKLDYNY